MPIEALNLTGKSAPVTGGSRGIGAACTKLLASATASITGAHVLIDGGMLA